MNLEEISKKYGTGKNFSGGDKCTRHNYCEKYDRHFKEIYDKEVKLLEIGILEGRSLKAWKDYFKKGTITGIDINESCLMYKEDRINIEIGNQKDIEFLKKVESKFGPFDIVIDDGSHIWEDIIISFEFLFPLLKGNGIYIIEDLHTSYNNKFSGKSKISAIEYLKLIVDKINVFGKYDELIENPGYKHARQKQKTVLDNKLNKLDCSYDAYSICFYPSICFIQKEKEYQNENKRKIY